MKLDKIFVASALILIVAACGQSKTDRGVSGGLIGAGVGAVGSGLVGVNPVEGALIGGAVGAGTGVLTKP